MTAASMSTSAWRPAWLDGPVVRVALGFAVLSLLSGAFDAPDLFSRGGISATLRFSAPILLAGLGALWAERSGVINLGLEGMMIAGTWFGAWAAIEWGIGPGLVAGIGAGVAFGLLLAVLTATLGVDQAISGLSLGLLAAGLTRFLSSTTFAGVPGGSITTSPPVPDLATVSVPGIDALLAPAERAGVPILSDAAAVFLGLVTDVSVLTIAVVALVPLTWYVLWRTRLGLRIRAVGEAPEAADSLGVRPWRYRYLALYEIEGDPGDALAALAAQGMGSKDSYTALKEVDQGELELPEWFERTGFASWNCIALGDRVDADDPLPPAA